MGMIKVLHLGQLHKLTCVFLTATGLTTITTEMIKLYCGYLRPIFLTTCAPDGDYQQCTNDESDDRLSFPSGHASHSVCGLLIACYFLERTFGVSSICGFKVIDQATGSIGLSYSSPPGFRKIISVLCYAPMLFAIYVSVSRIHDNKHFPADVVGGALLGGAIGTFVYNIWFPSWPTTNKFDER
jgi:diacylglycerol diphosphate phosphatase / phosphatidate phosphatase